MKPLEKQAMTEICHAYRRYSSPKQKEGSSEERQDQSAEKAAEKKGWLLDTSLDLAERGVSAFRSKNSLVGKLWKYKNYIKDGTVKPGSILMVEWLDRLSRDQIWNALTLIGDLLRSGVKVYEIESDMLYTFNDLNDMPKLMMLVVKLAAAHEHSKKGSERSKYNWNKRRANMGKQVLTSSCPHWLRVKKDGTGFDTVPEREAAIKQVFQWCKDGMGCTTIARKLNLQGVVLTNRGKPINKTNIGSIIQDRRVLGEFTPMEGKGKDAKPACDPIPDYYPRIVEDTLFTEANNALRGRKIRQGKRSLTTKNIFAGIMFNARDGYLLIMKDAVPRPYTKNRRMFSVGQHLGAADAVGGFMLYELIERNILKHLHELDPASVFPDQSGEQAAQLKALDTRLSSIKTGIKNMQDLIAEDPSEASYTVTLRKLVGERNKVQEKYETLAAQFSSPDVDTLRSVQDTLRSCPGGFNPTDEDTRLRLHSALRRIVSELWVVKFGSRTNPLYIVQVFYRSGETRFVIFDTKGVDTATEKLGGQVCRSNGDLRKFRFKDHWDLCKKVVEDMESE